MKLGFQLRSDLATEMLGIPTGSEATMTHALWLGLLALVLLATETAPVRADIPGPHPRPRPGPPLPPPPPFTEGPVVPDPFPPAPAKPKRTGPFRSCGSGMGTGLAGIGLAWGMLWLGNRFARTQRSPSGRG